MSELDLAAAPCSLCACRRLLALPAFRKVFVLLDRTASSKLGNVLIDMESSL